MPKRKPKKVLMRSIPREMLVDVCRAEMALRELSQVYPKVRPYARRINKAMLSALNIMVQRG